MDNTKLQVVTFKATPEQIERLRKMSKATGKRTSTLMRDIVDSALLIERPLVASNYKGGPVQHAS